MLIQFELEGSSPRVWGAERRPDGVILQPGIIPARAGSSNGALDLPRAVGIIPARAGSSRCTRRYPASRRDHPRACGEQPSVAAVGTDGEGSSPRVRGAAARGLRHTVERGIIPARAGSSAQPCAGRTVYRDHPRACGEQFLWQLLHLSVRGSSPRVRGADPIHVR